MRIVYLARPVSGHGEHIIEIAADLVPLSGRRVLHRQIHPRHPRHLGQQQAALQRPAGLQLLRVQPRVIERERRPATEIFHHLDSLAREAVTAGPTDDEHAEHPPARDQRAAPDGVRGQVRRTWWERRSSHRGKGPPARFRPRRQLGRRHPVQQPAERVRERLVGVPHVRGAEHPISSISPIGSAGPIPHQVNSAPGGYSRHHELGGERDRLVLVKGASEQIARLREEAYPPAPSALELSEPYPLERKRDPVSDRLQAFRISMGEPVLLGGRRREQTGHPALDKEWNGHQRSGSIRGSGRIGEPAQVPVDRGQPGEAVLVVRRLRDPCRGPG